MLARDRTMTLTRLSWAGLRLELADLRVVIDPLGGATLLSRLGMGEPRRALVPAAQPASVDLALITHLHPDHCDPPTLIAAMAPEGRVFCPASLAPRLADAGLHVQALSVWERARFPSLTVAAVPAVDGLGEDQLSWMLEFAGRRVFHAGDTLWHGFWWRIARELGPPTVAFLPVNGAVVAFPGMRASSIPAAMTPEQAVAAAAVLGAERLVPIHYGEFHNPPVYVETPAVLARLKVAAEGAGISVAVTEPGEEVIL